MVCFEIQIPSISCHDRIALHLREVEKVVFQSLSLRHTALKSNDFF